MKSRKGRPQKRFYAGNDVLIAGLKISLDTYGSGSVKSESWEFVIQGRLA